MVPTVGGKASEKAVRQVVAAAPRGEIDPTFVIAHRMPLARAAEAYRPFDLQADHVIKVALTL